MLAATRIFGIAGLGAFHTSVLLGDMEYFFNQQGIVCSPPLSSHLVGHQERPPELRTEVLSIGESVLTGRALARGLDPFFARGTYDLLCKNCNAFTDAALYFLTRKRLDDRFNRLERLILAARPVSTTLVSGFLRARLKQMGADAEEVEETISIWQINPLADGFSVEDVVTSCDVRDAEAAAGSTQTKSPKGWKCCGHCRGMDVVIPIDQSPVCKSVLSSADEADEATTVSFASSQPNKDSRLRAMITRI